MRWVASLAMAWTFTLCAGPSNAADLERSSLRLAVGGKVLVAYLPLTIAERRGSFAKEGLAVNAFVERSTGLRSQ